MEKIEELFWMEYDNSVYLRHGFMGVGRIIKGNRPFLYEFFHNNLKDYIYFRYIDQAKSFLEEGVREFSDLIGNSLESGVSENPSKKLYWKTDEGKSELILKVSDIPQKLNIATLTYCQGLVGGIPTGKYERVQGVLMERCLPVGNGESRWDISSKINNYGFTEEFLELQDAKDFFLKQLEIFREGCLVSTILKSRQSS